MTDREMRELAVAMIAQMSTDEMFNTLVDIQLDEMKNYSKLKIFRLTEKYLKKSASK